MVSKTEIFSSYRHISTKILNEFPEVIEKVSGELAGKRDQFKLSIESKVNNPESTIESFNRQFQLGKIVKEAVEWVKGKGVGNKSSYSNVSDETGLNRIPKLFNVFHNFHVLLYQIIYHRGNVRILFFSDTSNKRKTF